MGGGKKKDKRREDEQYRRTVQMQDQIRQPSEWEQYLMNKFRAQQAWEGSAGKDIRDMPGMDEYIQIADAALERQKRGRIGTGALALSGATGNGESAGYAAKLKELYNKESGQEIGAGLERARALTRAENLGAGQSAAEFGFNRQQAALGSSQGIFQTMWRPKRSFFDYAMGIGNLAVSGASAAAGFPAFGGGR